MSIMRRLFVIFHFQLYVLPMETTLLAERTGPFDF